VDGPSDAVRSAAERLFNTMTDIMNAGAEAGAYDARDVGRLTLLLASEALIDDAITLFLAVASTQR
jgi:hypothetical protein